MSRLLSLLLLAVVAAPVASHAQSPWRQVQRYLQPDAEIVSQTDERLVIAAGGQRFVLSTQSGAGVDVLGALARNRDGNPYRVWQATPNLWLDTSRPRSGWGRFLRSDFLRLIRSPDPDALRDAQTDTTGALESRGILSFALAYLTAHEHEVDTGPFQTRLFQVSP